ncbi:golgin subfamily A member 6-like protein 6 isoform X4 [Astatotilapia calliptera]|uniref:golgin subfamily A member 6-like protein 6 isoform X4 n=1 Tax=Astatotilapia calliptera TaxID=8154 RepID=UPI000E4195C4|nr:golgin subfamily A member 6-like protein 6 isoform X4 [Astatotilapia calliptera]
MVLKCVMANTDESMHTGFSRRAVSRSLRAQVKKELCEGRLQPHVWRASETEKLMDFGDPEPSHLPNLTPLRKAKHEQNQLEVAHKNPVLSLHSLKYSSPHNGSIWDIGLDKFFCHYWSQTQMLMYKIEKHPIVAFDATGSVVKKLLRPNGLSGNIFLYQGVLTGRDNSHVPMVQMLSERHDVQAITRWLSEVGREVVVHQLNVRRSKSKRLVKAEKHALFIDEAPQKIAAALAEDPAEDTLQSRALTTNAIATYAANKRKRREDRGSVQDEDSEGSEKEEQQSSGTEELLDRTLFQCSSNKMVSPGQGEVACSAGATIRETKQDLKKGVEHLQKVTYQLRKRKMVVFYKNDRTDVGKLTQEDNPEEEEEDEAREWVPKSVSSSEDDGTDDWKPTQDESEGYSEEEEEQERKRIPKMVAASEEDGTHDSRPTQDESKDDSKDEAEHLGQMIHKVAMEKMQQAYVSQDKAMTVNKSSEKRVIHQTRCLKRLTFHQSTLFEDTIPRSDNNKKDQSGMSSAAIITSEQLEEKGIQEESLEKMKSEDKVGERKEKVQQEPLEKMKSEAKVRERKEKVQQEPLKKMKSEAKVRERKEKVQQEPLEKMKSEAKVRERKEKVQQEPLEKMRSEAKVGKRKEKVQQEPLEKMRSEAKVGKRKEKVQQEPLEKMKSEAKVRERKEKVQQEPLEKMRSEAKVGKRKEKVQQEPLEKMSGKRKRKEEKIQAEPLEKMKSEAKVGKRKEKVQQEPLEKMSGKRQRKEEKIQAEPLEKMKSEAKVRERKEKVQQEPLEKMSGKRKRKEEKIQAEPLEKMKSEAKVEKRKEKVQQEPLEKMSGKRKRKEEKIQAEPLEKMKSEAKVGKRKEKVQQEPLEKMKSEGGKRTLKIRCNLFHCSQ